MKVIEAGFGRTGTMSIKAALEELGFGPCYHMTELFGRPEHVEFWDDSVDRAKRGEPVEWEKVFSGYEATLDWPGCLFYGELMEAYPDARVLLNVRDPESWYESVAQTVARGPGSDDASPARSLFFKAARLVIPSMRRAPSMMEKVITQGTFDGRFKDREHVIGRFVRHTEEVKERVPPEKRLVYEVTQGWEPLCAFLGVEVPKGRPFPHLNDREEFPRMMRRRMVAALAPRVAGARAAAYVLLVALWALRMAARSQGRGRRWPRARRAAAGCGIPGS